MTSYSASVLKKPWNHSLFSCTEDWSACRMGFFCPCVAHGKIAEHVGQRCGVCGCLACTPAYPCALWFIRGAIREKHELEGNSCSDFMTSLCCPCCACIQEKAEINDFEAMHFGGVDDPYGLAPSQVSMDAGFDDPQGAYVAVPSAY